MGKVRGESIQCPYHGWEWAGEDGACTRIPSLPDPSQIPSRARIQAFPAREHWGLVWTVLEEPVGELPTMTWFDAEEWTWGHGTPFELPVGLGVMIENFRDVAHFAFVHQATLGAIAEVIEPLRPERGDEFRVTLRRAMRAGEGADAIWGSLRELHTHVIAPNFTSGQILTAKGERCVLHAARAISPTESAHYWIAGLTEDYDEHSLEEAIEFEERLYIEDRAVISALEPRELQLDPNADVNTLADRFTLAYRQAFREFVDRALAERPVEAASIAG